MASSLLEELRSRQEEIENFEDAIAYVLKLKKQSTNSKNVKINNKNRLLYENAIKLILLEIQANANACLQIYEDKDGMRKQENAYLAGMSADKSTSSFSEIWPRYYERIKNIKNYNKKFQLKTMTFQPEDKEQIAEKFIEMARELIGDDDLLLDLNEHFNFFINLQKIKAYRVSQFRSNEIARLKKKGMNEEEISSRNIDASFQEIDYVHYLKTFHKFEDIPRYCKYDDKSYSDYLISLLEYLVDFFQKLNPLASESILRNKLTEEFEEKWQAKEISGWEEYTCNMSLYCKVTDKLFASQGVLDSHKQGKKYNKKLKALMSMTMEEQKNLTENSKKKDEELAIKEFLVVKFADILNDQIEKAIEFLQKIQSKTATELELLDESDEEEKQNGEESKEEDEDENEDEDEKPIYNPLNLPLGWDGKPIAYWLYKLHGLGVEYKCEICGNYSYWGRKSFEKHFQEWRHSFGMRCLKIPNTIHFKEITKIEDAITLYEKLRKEADSHTFKNELEVECEDSQGNVMSMRDYHDLLKQGLI